MSAETTSVEIDGVRVLHRRISGHPLVAMQIKFDELQPPTGQQYWAEVLALDVLAAVGPRSLGVSEWNARLSRMGAEVRSAGGIDYHSLSAEAPRSEWRATWSLLIRALRDPETSNWYLDDRRRLRQYGLVSERDQPMSAAGAAAYEQVFRGTPGNLPRETRASLANITSSDLPLAWRALLTKERLLVSLVGDLSLDEAK